jgi:voltage-gated potassium channel Kch
VAAPPGRDVWTTGLIRPSWRTPQGDASPVLFLAGLLADLSLLFSILTYAGIGYGWKTRGWSARSEARFPRVWVDVWVLLLLGTEVIVLVENSPGTAGWRTLAWYVAIWALLDNGAVVARDFVISPAVHDGRLVYADARRWVLLTALNLIQIILSFALLFLVYACYFNPPIDRALTAIYYSVVTFITLGYGDYRPTLQEGRGLVIGELAFVLAFLPIKLPIAVAVLRAEREVV